MAFIGVRKPVIAQLLSHEDGQEPEYRSGRVLGRAIQISVTKAHNNNPLYADDIIDEDDNSLTGMTISVNLNDLDDSTRYTLLQGAVKTASPSSDGYDDCADSSPTVGFGYIRVRQKGGDIFYQAVWCWKVMFSEENEETKTKGESIEWQTPTIQGRARGAYIDASGIPKFRRRKTFESYSDAIHWLEVMANVCIENLFMKMFRFKDPSFTLKQVLTVPPMTSMSSDFSAWPTEEEVASIEEEGFDPLVYNYTAVVNTAQGVNTTDVELKYAGGYTPNNTAGLKSRWVGSVKEYYLQWGNNTSESVYFYIRMDGELGTKFYCFRIFHNYT